MITGDKASRIAALRQDADVGIINRENLQWLAAGYVNARKPWPFDTVIVDESAGFKSPDAIRWKALAWARPHIHRLVLLTGTPITNGHEDLWAQLYLIDKGQRLFPTVTAFRDYACTFDFKANKFTVRDEPMKQWIHDQIRDVVLPMRAEDWLDMPELLTIDVPVALPASARKAYDQMVKDFIIEVGEVGIEAVNTAAKAGKLAQIANGAVYDAEGAWHPIHDAKLEALEELIEAAGGEPVMVCYAFKHDLARIKARFPASSWRSVKEPGAVDAWNRGEVPILLLHAASAGEGLNLQDGGRHIVWFGPTYSLKDYKQTVARLWRQGQRNRVICHRLLGVDTIDYGIVDILNGKATGLAELMRDLLNKPVTVQPESLDG
jgi:SNF2 family DNA or RNA helicase